MASDEIESIVSGDELSQLEAEYNRDDKPCDPEPLHVPIPPTLTEVQREELARDIRTGENAARVRAQTIALYAREVADTWPAVYEAIRALKLETHNAANSGPISGLHADRVKLATAALLVYTAAVARLNQALQL